MKLKSVYSILASAFIFMGMMGCEKDIPKPIMGSFTDSRDGHEYLTVAMGDQIWMAENLAFLPNVSPPAQGGYEEPFYYVPDYEGEDLSEAKGLENYSLYGVLYNWKAATTACPDGWQLPSDAMWQTLEKYLGMTEPDLDETGLRSSGDLGIKLKSETKWIEEGSGENSSGFNAYPGGNRSKSGSFGTVGTSAGFWTGSASGSSVNFTRTLRYDSDGIIRSESAKNIGLSIRCIKKQIP